MKNKDAYSAAFQKQMDPFIRGAKTIPAKVKQAVGGLPAARAPAKTDKVFSTVLEPGEDDF